MSDIINNEENIKELTNSILKVNKNNTNHHNNKYKNQKNLNLKDVIANNYVILHLIGAGSFGKIYLSFNLRDNIEVVIKKEKIFIYEYIES